MASNDITVKEAFANIKDQYFNKNGDTATTRQYLIEKHLINLHHHSLSIMVRLCQF